MSQHSSLLVLQVRNYFVYLRSQWVQSLYEALSEISSVDSLTRCFLSFHYFTERLWRKCLVKLKEILITKIMMILHNCFEPNLEVDFLRCDFES